MSEEKTLADEEPSKLKACSLKAYAVASVLANHFQDELSDFVFQLYSVMELGSSISTKITEDPILSCVEGLILRAVDKNIPGFYINDKIKKELCIILFSAISRVGDYGKNKDYPKMDIARFLFDQDANEETIKSKVLQYFHHLVKTLEDERSSLSMLSQILSAPSHLYFIVDKIFMCQVNLFIEPQKENRKRIKQIFDQLFDLQLDFMMTHPIFGRTKEMIKIFFKLDFEYFYPKALYKKPYDIAFKVTSLLYDDKEEFYENIVLDFSRFDDKKWGKFPKIITHLILLEKNDGDFIKSAEANEAAVLAYAIRHCNKEFIRRYLGIVSVEQVKQILELLPEDDVKKLLSHMVLMSKFKELVTSEKYVLDCSRFNSKEWEVYAKAATLLILLEKNDEEFIKSAEANDAAVLVYVIRNNNDEFIRRYLSIVSVEQLEQILEILPQDDVKKLQSYVRDEERGLDFSRFNSKEWVTYAKNTTHLALIEKDDEDFIKSAEANDAAVLVYAIRNNNDEFIHRYLGVVSVEQLEQILEIFPQDDVKKLQSYLRDEKSGLDFSRFNSKEWDTYAKNTTHLALLEKDDEDFIKSAEANDAAVLAYAIRNNNDKFVCRYLGTVSTEQLKQTLEQLPKKVVKKFHDNLYKINDFLPHLTSACEKNQYRTVYNYFSIREKNQNLVGDLLLAYRKVSLPAFFDGNDSANTESEKYYHFEQCMYDFLDNLQSQNNTTDKRLAEKQNLVTQGLYELLNPKFSGTERIESLKAQLEELLHYNPETGIRKNRGTGGYFWYGFFNGIKNPFDFRYSRSTTETRAIKLYESLVSFQQTIPEYDEVLDDVHSQSMSNT